MPEIIGYDAVNNKVLVKYPDGTTQSVSRDQLSQLGGERGAISDPYGYQKADLGSYYSASPARQPGPPWGGAALNVPTGNYQTPGLTRPTLSPGGYSPGAGGSSGQIPYGGGAQGGQGSQGGISGIPPYGGVRPYQGNLLGPRPSLGYNPLQMSLGLAGVPGYRPQMPYGMGRAPGLAGQTPTGVASVFGAGDSTAQPVAPSSTLARPAITGAAATQARPYDEPYRRYVEHYNPSVNEPGQPGSYDYWVNVVRPKMLGTREYGAREGPGGR